MLVYFCKALDRPVDMFGLKGKWIVVALILIGVSVFVGFLFGGSLGGGIGFGIAFGLSGIAFIFCLTTQNKVNHRQVEKFIPALGISNSVARRETLNYILRKDLKGEALCRIRPDAPSAETKE